MYGSKNLKPEQQAKLTKGHEKNLRLFHPEGVDQGKYKSPKKQEEESVICTTCISKKVPFKGNYIII